MNINKKQVDLFLELSKYPGRNRTFDDLAVQLKVSSRSVRNYCSSLEDYISGTGIYNIIEHTTTGIIYRGTADQTRQIRTRISKSSFYEYHLSPDDRILAIVLILLDSQKPVTVMELCDTLFVSRATILNDMEKVRLYFQQFHISFSSGSHRGYHLEIQEARRQDIICTTCFPYLKDWEPSVDENNIFHFEIILNLQKILPDICRIVQMAEQQFDITIADISYKQTVFMFATLCKELIQGQKISSSSPLDEYLENISVGRIAHMMLREAKKTFQIDYSEEEVLYLAWHLHLCHFDILQNFEHSVDIFFYMEVHQFLHQIEQILPGNFTNNQYFVIMLTRHIWSIMNGDLGLDDILVDEIIDDYHDWYAVIKDNIGIIERSIGRKCTEIELTSILLHIIAESERQTRNSEKPGVIVLCHIGIGTANYLADRLKETFNLEIKEVTAIHKLPEVLKNNNFDLLISTVPLKVENVHWVNVSPNLEDADIIAIQKALTAVHKSKRSQQQPAKLQANPMDLADFIKPENIILDICSDNWRDALDIAATPLIENEQILPEYVTAIKRSVEINGPYFVFCPGVALAHAAPSDGVLQFCCSIYRPQNAVRFHHEKNDPVSFIIMVGITDVASQVSYVAALMNLFRNENLICQLQKADSPKDFLTLLLEQN